MLSRAQLPSVAGLTVWSIAAVVAVEGELLAASRPDEARWWLIAAAVLGLVAVRLLEVGEPPSDSLSHWGRAATGRRRLGGMAILALGGLYALLATLMIVLHVPEAAATWTWLFGLVATVTGTLLLSADAWRPHWPRAPQWWLEFGLLLVIAIPALVLAAALVLDSAWRGVTRLSGRAGTSIFAVPVVVLLGLAAQGNVHDYFDVQVVERQPAGRFALLSSYARSIQDHYRLYVIGRPDWTLNYETARFMVPNPDAVDVRSAALALPLDRIPSSKGVAFLVENGADDFVARMATIRDAYPDGHETVISQRPGTPMFTSYLVENPILSATSPGAVRD